MELHTRFQKQANLVSHLQSIRKQSNYLIDFYLDFKGSQAPTASKIIQAKFELILDYLSGECRIKEEQPIIDLTINRQTMEFISLANPENLDIIIFIRHEEEYESGMNILVTKDESDPKKSHTGIVLFGNFILGDSGFQSDLILVYQKIAEVVVLYKYINFGIDSNVEAFVEKTNQEQAKILHHYYKNNPQTVLTSSEIELMQKYPV